MAEKRMFSKKIIDSDLFLDMPASAQNLYFHLCMRADDDGFVDSPKKIQKMIGANDDDFKILIAKQFLLIFETGVIVIRHWKLHNTIANDRYKKTIHTVEKALTTLDDNKMYTLCNTNCLQTGNVDKARLDKISSEQASIISKKQVNTPPVDNSAKNSSAACLLTQSFLQHVEKIHECPAKQILKQPEAARKYLDKYNLAQLSHAIDTFIAKDGKYIKFFDILLADAPPLGSEWEKQLNNAKRKYPKKDCPNCKGEGFIYTYATDENPHSEAIECRCKYES